MKVEQDVIPDLTGTLTIAADGPDSAEAVSFKLRSENVLVLTWQDQKNVTLARVSFE